ncbi:LPXTG cell wall anchor domain-containing protein [Streptomyces sp. NPDC002809]|uniref:LPXTG cell wall anchor domain-containing protein n=1 Tax=Streptomyces sp. NPDC002809 TaxID=3154433 RepID=UPI00332FD50E
MAITRRPLMTATAAGTLLCALWFVPSANAGDAAPPPDTTGHSAAASGSELGPTTLAETGTGIDTTPYLVGGMALLGIGAGFVAYSGRRGGPQPAL